VPHFFQREKGGQEKRLLRETPNFQNKEGLHAEKSEEKRELVSDGERRRVVGGKEEKRGEERAQHL